MRNRELSAGAKPLRESFRSQHCADRVLMALPGVGTEAGTAGTAIDTRLRLAFTTAAPVDLAATIGWLQLVGGSVRKREGWGARRRWPGCWAARRRGRGRCWRG
ncbi:hypothetical protein ACFXKC_55570 [Streptomyces sp. NPDC059340]|uniref:hypothetical protein n=1 Tax=Streptomyces sp. NPDC059340 TaxID=3346806 RepID=UPI0036A8C041